MRQASSNPSLVTTPVMERLRVEGKPLGRHRLHDPRSREFPAARAAEIATVDHDVVGLPLRQHDLHFCGTAHSLIGAINASGRYGNPLNENNAVRIHERAREEFLVRDHDGRDLPGSSALAACRAAKSLGLIDGYTHAFGIEHALEALTLRPLITGFSWYEEFDTPDTSTGLVSMPDWSREPRGGHEVLVTGVDAAEKTVWCWNSWGPEYGSGGRFGMSWDLWSELLERGGDATVPLA